MGVTREVLDAVVEASTAAGATRIEVVRVTVGELTALETDSLLFAWECMTPGTLAEGAVLDITVTPARSLCLACGAEFGHDRFDRRCTACGGQMTEVISGNDLLIGKVEVDVPDIEEPE
jgi:hydrogenase nickel incorporation protein HypA/HybF